MKFLELHGERDNVDFGFLNLDKVDGARISFTSNQWTVVELNVNGLPTYIRFGEKNHNKKAKSFVKRIRSIKIDSKLDEVISV